MNSTNTKDLTQEQRDKIASLVSAQANLHLAIENVVRALPDSDVAAEYEKGFLEIIEDLQTDIEDIWHNG